MKVQFLQNNLLTCFCSFIKTKIARLLWACSWILCPLLSSVSVTLSSLHCLDYPNYIVGLNIGLSTLPHTLCFWIFLVQLYCFPLKFQSNFVYIYKFCAGILTAITLNRSNIERIDSSTFCFLTSMNTVHLSTYLFLLLFISLVSFHPWNKDPIDVFSSLCLSHFIWQS